jgi:hypothetical protein
VQVEEHALVKSQVLGQLRARWKALKGGGAPPADEEA